MANKMKYYREKKGLSQEELAEISKTPVELIKVIEEGKTVTLPTKQVASFAIALGVEPSTLFGDDYMCADYSEADSDVSDELRDKLDDYEGLCVASAEKLESLMNTLYQARIRIEETLHYKAAEFSMLYTVEIAMESIIRDLEAACD